MADSKRKLVLVTGGGRGIGREIALKLAADGFAVSVCARSTHELAETARLSAGLPGGTVRTSRADVALETEVERWIGDEVRAAETAGLAPWGLVTAAGIHGDIAPFLEADLTEWRRGLEVNLFGTLYACGAFARALAGRKRPGRIVLLSGGGATKAIENMSSYCASKSAVVRFGQTLAVELAPHAITVNAIAPGAVNTALTKTIIDAGRGKAGDKLFAGTEKQLRDGGTPPDKAAALVSYLMSEQSAPVTGRLISAVWDEWATLHENKALLADREAFTLTRKLLP